MSIVKLTLKETPKAEVLIDMLKELDVVASIEVDNTVLQKKSSSWNTLTKEQFLKGYTEEDSIYDHE